MFNVNCLSLQKIWTTIHSPVIARFLEIAQVSSNNEWFGVSVVCTLATVRPLVSTPRISEPEK